MSDLTITIKENSELYKLLKKEQLLDNTQEILYKVMSAIALEHYLREEGEEEITVNPNSDYYENLTEKMSMKELAGELNSVIGQMCESTEVIINFLEDNFCPLYKEEIEHFTVFSATPGFTYLKYASEILPILMERITVHIENGSDNKNESQDRKES